MKLKKIIYIFLCLILYGTATTETIAISPCLAVPWVECKGGFCIRKQHLTNESLIQLEIFFRPFQHSCSGLPPHTGTAQCQSFIWNIKSICIQRTSYSRQLSAVYYSELSSPSRSRTSKVKDRVMCGMRGIVYRYGDQGIVLHVLILKRINAQFRDVIITGIGNQVYTEETSGMLDYRTFSTKTFRSCQGNEGDTDILIFTTTASLQGLVGHFISC